MPTKKASEMADSLDKLSASLRGVEPTDLPKRPETLDRLAELVQHPETAALMRRVTETLPDSTSLTDICCACCLLGGGGGGGGSGPACW